MPYTNPTSDKDKSIDKELADLKAIGLASSAEIRRLTDLNRPGNNSGATVINRTKPATHATLAVWGDPATNVATDTTTQEAALAADVDSILKGEPLSEHTDIRSLLATEHRRRAAIESAIEAKIRESNVEKTRLAIEYSRELLPDYTAEMKILCTALLAVRASHVRLGAMRQHLVDNNLGFRNGVMALTADSFLGHPMNQHSDFVSFLQEAKQLGFITKRDLN
jgi:hypothetical protein